MPDYDSWGQRFKQFRMQTGLSQCEFADNEITSSWGLIAAAGAIIILTTGFWLSTLSTFRAENSFAGNTLPTPKISSASVEPLARPQQNEIKLTSSTIPTSTIDDVGHRDPTNNVHASSPWVKLVIPETSPDPQLIQLSVDGKIVIPTVQSPQNIQVESGRLYIRATEENPSTQWGYPGKEETLHPIGSRIGFAFDFEWKTIPQEWVHFPFAGMDVPEQGSPSFAMQAGKMGIRYGVGGSRGFDEQWYYTEGAQSAKHDNKAAKLPIIGRRYRIKGYYDYKPEGGASVEAWVTFSDDGGQSWSEWHQFANTHNIAIGFQSNGGLGMRARGGAVHTSTTFEGYIYGWGFGYADAETAAAAIFERGS